MAAALSACARFALAGASGSPGSGTSASPAPLGAEQLRAIAAKDAARVAATRAPAAAPPMQMVDGKLVPLLSAQPAARVSTAGHAPLRWPTISPSIGAIPRLEWGHPNALSKQADIAVIGSRRVAVGAAPSVAPATSAPGGKP